MLDRGRGAPGKKGFVQEKGNQAVGENHIWRGDLDTKRLKLVSVT